MTNLEILTTYSNLIIAVSAVLGVVYIIFVSGKILTQVKRNDYLTQSLKEREFYSRYDNDRLNLERRIADLNIQMTQSLKQFEQVNHLVIDGQKRLSGLPNQVIDPESFLESLSVKTNELSVDRNLVFVLTPFHPSEQRTYSAIVEALSSYGIRVIRGDEESVRGDILTHIIRQLLSSRLIIANINTRNPNVMYELGIAHALGKDVVMVANSDADLPFDVNSRRILFYSTHEQLVDKLRQELGRKIFDK